MKKGFRILKFKKDKPVFEVQNLSKSFDGRPILKKINLRVWPGAITGLLGPNGAGKSTLFNIAIGAESSDSGKILLNNKSIEQVPIHLRSKEGLGYLPQQRTLFNMSVHDNLMGCVQLKIKDGRKQKEITNSLLEEFNLMHLKNINANFVSGGESKRIMLARLMITKPKIVLLDEIFSQIDPIWVQDIQKYIMKIQSAGVSVLICDHNVRNLFEITDNNYVISDGTIIAEGTSNELLKNTKAVQSYFGADFTYK